MFCDKKITVLIPAMNEEKSIGKVLRDIPKNVVDEVIVIDNGSGDRTAEIAREAGAKVFQEEKRGYGAACLRGLGSIDQTDIVVVLDADYSDYPEQVTRLLEPIVNNEADFVIGSRVLGNREKGALPPQVIWGNRLATFLIRMFYGFHFTDMGPFRAIRFESIKDLKMEDTTFGWNVEMQTKAIKSKLRIQEVAVDYRKRIGKSKISGTISGTIFAGYKIITTIFKYFNWKPNGL